MTSSLLKIQQTNKFIKDWVLIFKLDEIHNLLSYKDLKSLSLVSKSIYYKTRPLLLTQIYINLPILFKNLVNNKGGENDKKLKYSNDLLNRFNISVKAICNYVDSVHIKQPPLFPEPYLYLKVFKNLKRLHIYQPRTKINLTSMNLILTRLPSIIDLNLEDISIESDEKGNANKLLLPSTLTILSINNVHWSDYQRVLRENTLDYPSLGPYSIIKTQNFAQLYSFEYSSPSSSLDFNPINSILENSPKLEVLKMETRHINQETFTLMGESLNLKSIELSNLEGRDIELDDYNRLPSYSSITQLSYQFIKKSPQTLTNAELLIFHFINLTSFSISFEKPFLPYLKRILKNLPKLQQLELINGCIENRALPLKLINRSINQLTLINFKLNQVNFEDFERWYALKSIKFEISGFIHKLGLPIGRIVNLNNFKFEANWKVFDYKHCIRFYKE